MSAEQDNNNVDDNTLIEKSDTQEQQKLILPEVESDKIQKSNKVAVEEKSSPEKLGGGSWGKAMSS